MCFHACASRPWYLLSPLSKKYFPCCLPKFYLSFKIQLRGQFCSSTFPFVYCINVYWVVTLCQALFWVLEVPAPLWLSFMCSHDLLGKSLLQYLSCCSLTFSLPVFPTRLWVPGRCNYALSISALCPAQRRSSVNVCWPLTTNEEREYCFPGCSHSAVF